MSEISELIISMLFILSLQVMVYAVFLRPKILTWGASNEEVEMFLLGDNLAPRISATRAIAINAPISKVWQWVIQLGADRGGFLAMP